ncbi:MAG: hypothetical protein MZV65_21295 [Chromatiales bacterium]|nr:hypothetical protein [Chromatiales bacterium]
MVDFVYQAAKAVVAASNPTRVHDGRVDIRTNLEASVLREQLQRNHEPIDRLYATLEAYLFRGYPCICERGSQEENAPPLAMLIGMAERFIVGHEYGHKPAKRVHAHTAALSNPKWAEEFLPITTPCS